VGSGVGGACIGGVAVVIGAKAAKGGLFGWKKVGHSCLNPNFNGCANLICRALVAD